MVTVYWLCDKCFKKEKTDATFDEWHVDVVPPVGWGAIFEPNILLCPKCKKDRYEQWRKDNPDLVLMA